MDWRSLAALSSTSPSTTTVTTNSRLKGRGFRLMSRFRSWLLKAEWHSNTIRSQMLCNVTCKSSLKMLKLEMSPPIISMKKRKNPNRQDSSRKLRRKFASTKIKETMTSSQISSQSTALRSFVRRLTAGNYSENQSLTCSLSVATATCWTRTTPRTR